VVLDTAHDTIERRERLRDGSLNGYLRVRDDRIPRLDPFCGGYHPVDAPATGSAAASASSDRQLTVE
jgi:hypothetical protein